MKSTRLTRRRILTETIVVGAVLTAAGALAACSTASSKSSAGSGTIKIGVPTALSGSNAQGGKDMVNTANLAAQEINAAGGVLGRKVTVVPEDDACDAQTGVQAAQKLVDQGVSLVVGGYCSGVSIAEETVFKRANIPFVLSISSNTKLTHQGDKNVARVIFNDDQLAPVEASYMVNYLHANRIAIVTDDSTFGTGNADQAKAALAAYPQASIVASERITAGHSDYTSTLVKVGQLKPDLLLFTGYYAEGAIISRERSQLGQSYHLMGTVGIADPGFIKAAAGSAEGVDFVTAILTDFATNAPATSFAKNYKAAYGVSPSSYTIYQYDSMQVAFQAIKNAGSTDHAKLIAALAKTDYDGITGRIRFNSEGDRSDVPALVAAVKAGQFTPEAVLDNGSWKSAPS